MKKRFKNDRNHVVIDRPGTPEEAPKEFGITCPKRIKYIENLVDAVLLENIEEKGKRCK